MARVTALIITELLTRGGLNGCNALGTITEVSDSLAARHQAASALIACLFSLKRRFNI